MDVQQQFPPGPISMTSPPRCLHQQCGYAPLPPGWTYKLCSDCLARRRNARSKRAMDLQGAQATTVDKAGVASKVAPAPRKADPLRNIVPCFYCSAHVIVPPGHAGTAPLLCESCFRRAVATKEERQPVFQLPNISKYAQHPSFTTLNLASPSSLSSSSYYMKPCDVTPENSVLLSRIKIPQPPAIPPRAVPAPNPVVLPPDNAMPSETPADPAGDVMDLDLDDLELAYPEEDPDTTLPSSSLPAAPAVQEDHLSSVPSPHPSPPAPAFELPEGWDSDVSELTVLTDSGESEIDSDGEVVMPVKTGLKIRIKIPPGFRFGSAPSSLANASAKLAGDGAGDGASPTGQRTCRLKRCQRLVEPGSRWKLCEPCRVKFRHYQRARLNIQRSRLGDTEQHDHGPKAAERAALAAVNNAMSAEASASAPADANNPMPAEISGVAPVNVNSITPSEMSRASSPEVPLSELVRECAKSSCHNALPSPHLYRYKRCEPCRIRGRFSTKRRRALEAALDGGEKRKGLSQQIIQQYHVQQTKRAKFEARTAAAQSSPAEQKLDHDHNMKLPVLQFAIKPEEKPVLRTDQPESVMMYQHKEEMLHHLRVYVTDFLRGLIQYARIRVKAGLPDALPEPIVFGFDGQYSTVTDAALDSEYTGEEMLHMKKGIEEVLGLRFSPITFPSLEGDDIVAVFSCLHNLTLPVSPSMPAVPSQQNPNLSQPIDPMATQPKPVLVSRKMSGEIQLRVTEDRSHPYFSGHQTTVHFRLAG